HGAGAGWYSNPSNNGLIVNGENVTAYGLFVEHFQQYQTLWNGNGGAVYLYQSEMPYDPPYQDAWNAPGEAGYPSYKVADGVTSHIARGLGVYSVFSNYITASNAIESPSASGVSLAHLVSVSLASGQILHIVNGGGDVVNANRPVASTWETFTLDDLNGGTLHDGDAITLEAHNGQFVAAEGGGGGAVNANRNQALDWETFIVHKAGGGIIGSGD